jgi:hypothetical protein
MTPLEEHITHGLYGVFIVDPQSPRPPADEMVMVMNGYDTDFDTENNFYTVNEIPYYYMYHPVQFQKDKLVRIYLVNMLEFDPLNNFHLHANMFDYYPSGTRLQPDELIDIVTTNQGERHFRVQIQIQISWKIYVSCTQNRVCRERVDGNIFCNGRERVSDIESGK